MKVYASRFEFATTVGLETFVAATRRWLADPRRFGPLPADANLLQVWSAQSAIRKGGELSVDLFQDDNTKLWGCRFSHPDDDYPEDRRWTTHIGVRLTDQVGVCSVFLDLESSDQTVTMQRFTPSRPQVVVDLLDAIGEEALDDVPTSVRTVRRRQVEDFHKFIRAPSRTLPIILVTTNLQSERPLVTPSRLASLLVAMTYVYQFDDKFTGLDFSEQVGNEWSVWDGAIRVYWPFTEGNDTPRQHRRWMPWHIEDLRRVGEPESGIFRYICRNACMIPSDMLITNDDVARARSRSRLQELTAKVAKTAELDKLVSMYSTVLDDTEGRLRRSQSDLSQAKAEITVLQAKHEAAQSDNNALRQSIRELYEHEGKDLPDVARDSLADIIDASSTVGDVSQFISDAYKDRLLFLPAAMRDVQKSLFERLEQFAEALRILATRYWSLKTQSDSTLDQFRDALAEHGIQYASRISDVTAGRYGREYGRRYKDNKVDMNDHLKLGSSRDPRFTMRIHFQWDEEEHLVVINYCGWHTKTGS